MPLYPKKYQPYFLDPDAPSRYSCAGEYLYPVIPSDLIYWQGEQTPCGQNIVEDPDFENSSLGSELLTNGDFTCPYTPWVDSGNWSCVSDGAQYTGGLGVSDLSQAIAISIGDLVEVTFTVSGLFNGGGLLVYVGDDLLATITDPGTYTISGPYSSGSAELLFQVPALSAIASLILDDVSAKILTMTDWDGNGEWSFGDLVACHTVSGTGDLTNLAANYIASGKRYRVTFKISGYSTGTVTPKVGATPSAAQSGNGFKTVWINATGNGVLAFTPTSNFVGCISDIDVREMKVAADFTWQIISELGDGDVYDMVSYVELDEDTLTLIYDPQDANLPEGCYIMRIFDTCTVQYEDQAINGTFFGGTTSSVPDWFINNAAAQYDLSGDQAKFIYNGILPQITTPILANTANPLLVDGNYSVSFDIISNTDTTNIGVRVRLRGDSAVQAYYSTVGTHTFAITGYAPSPAVIRAIIVNANFALLGVNTAGNIVIDNVKVFRTAPFTATYTSEGIKYKPNQAHTRLIRGYCLTNNLGYIFENTDFYIQQRVKIRTINPTYPSSSGITKSGNGNARLYYGELEKYFTVFTDLLDESAHDAMAVMLQCTNFEIQDDNDQWVAYTTDGEPYEPQWFPSGIDMTTAPAVFKVRIKDGGQVFNRHY